MENPTRGQLPSGTQTPVTLDKDFLLYRGYREELETRNLFQENRFKLDPEVSYLIYHLPHQYCHAGMCGFHLCYHFSKLVTQSVIVGTIVFPLQDLVNVSRQVLQHLFARKRLLSQPACNSCS